MALLFVFGLLAGSDGEWFPWPNLVGIGMFILFVILGRRVEDDSI
jgi:hypothetical protein